ncbi:hypothetical protein PG985_006041 [Apiospora marii]|uniref:Uncharacterized protein n=1 Tax=Apiospora marii TaxID=335849 RepID=A0ABR1S6I8_9PEZI
MVTSSALALGAALAIGWHGATCQTLRPTGRRPWLTRGEEGLMSAEVELGNEAPSLSSTEHRARNVTKGDGLQMGDATTTHWHRQARKPRKTQHPPPPVKPSRRINFIFPSIPSLVDSTADAIASLTSVGNVTEYNPSSKPGVLDHRYGSRACKPSSAMYACVALLGTKECGCSCSPESGWCQVGKSGRKREYAAGSKARRGRTFPHDANGIRNNRHLPSTLVTGLSNVHPNFITA